MEENLEHARMASSSASVPFNVESSSDFTGLVKLTEDGNDDNFFFADEVKLFAGSEVRFVARQKTIPSPCEKLNLFFAFGGNPAGTSITIKDIILQKHRD